MPKLNESIRGDFCRRVPLEERPASHAPQERRDHLELTRGNSGESYRIGAHNTLV